VFTHIHRCVTTMIERMLLKPLSRKCCNKNYKQGCTTNVKLEVQLSIHRFMML